VSALDKAVEHKITTRVCSSLQALYEFPPTLQAQALAGKAASECRDVGAQQVLRTVFLGHDIARIAREVERLSLVFEADAVSGTGLLREIETATTTLGHASAQGDARLFEETLASLKQFGERVGLSGGDLDPSVLRERFVVQAAERGAFRSIFAIVPSIRLDKRTPAVHAAVLRALDSVPADNVAGLVTVDTQAALQIFAQKDDEIDLRNQEMVRRGIRYCLAHGQSDDAFRLLRGVRSASGILPDKLVPLVSDVVEKFLDQSQRGRAEEVVTVFNQRLGVFAQLKFILARFGLAFISAVSVLLILISCGFIWYIRRCTRQAAKSLLGAETSSVPKASPPSKELVRALASFGLEPGATLSEIKNAYRVRVKECHPDRNPDAASRDNDEFVRLTTEYDRLLMLYHRERTADK
jgi:hypothetical protein